jgi:hypothetical protein
MTLFPVWQYVKSPLTMRGMSHWSAIGQPSDFFPLIAQEGLKEDFLMIKSAQEQQFDHRKCFPITQ